MSLEILKGKVTSWTHYQLRTEIQRSLYESREYVATSSEYLSCMKSAKVIMDEVSRRLKLDEG